MSKSLSAAAVLVCLALLPSAAHAVDSKIREQLLKLDPRTRLEQACDTEVMIRIKSDEGNFRPDKVIAYTFRDPTYGPNAMTAPGAVFRSGGEWYHLSYRCETGPHNVDVRKLDYEIGGKVAKATWDKYFLYD